MSQKTKKILLTGPPGCGKTTVIRKLATRLPGAAGFYTAEIREAGARKGFRLVDLRSGEEQVLSHVNIKGPRRVGKYGVDIEGFERFLKSLNLDSPVVLIDEIGKMECLSSQFKMFIEKLLGSAMPVIATIAQHGTPFIESLKHLPDSRLVVVTPENRDALPDSIIQDLSEPTFKEQVQQRLLRLEFCSPGIFWACC